VRQLLSRLAVHRKLMAMLMITSGTALLLASSMSILYAFVQVREEMAITLGSTARLVLWNTRPLMHGKRWTRSTRIQASVWPACTGPRAHCSRHSVPIRMCSAR
jgi:hypothetical protein